MSDIGASAMSSPNFAVWTTHNKSPKGQTVATGCFLAPLRYLAPQCWKLEKLKAGGRGTTGMMAVTSVTLQHEET